MSGISLLLNTSIDYERTHQIVLHTLLNKSNLAEHLFCLKEVREILWEPKKGLFDLALKSKNEEIYIEIKMWSSLSNMLIPLTPVGVSG